MIAADPCTGYPAHAPCYRSGYAAMPDPHGDNEPAPGGEEEAAPSRRGVAVSDEGMREEDIDW